MPFTNPVVSSVKTVQSVLIGMGNNTTQPVTITTVSARAYIVNLGTDVSSSNFADGAIYLQLTDTSTVTAIRAGASGSPNISLMVVDPG